VFLKFIYNLTESDTAGTLEHTRWEIKTYTHFRDIQHLIFPSNCQEPHSR